MWYQDVYKRQVVSLPRTEYLFFNQEVELFSNEKVRQAFSIALNREEIASEVYQGMQEPAYGWIPNSMQVDGVNFREMAGEPIQEPVSYTHLDVYKRQQNNNMGDG